MAETAATDPLHGQRWDGQLGRDWAERAGALERQLAPVATLALGLLDAAPGERIIDLGCGHGPTTEALALAVGPSGRVTGIDISPELAAMARARLERHAQAEVVLADAATHAFAPGACDALFSRMGCMFFEDAAAAFTNLRAALRPGGRVVLACFRGMEANPWAMLPVRLAEPVLGPAVASTPGLPGPFGWAASRVFEPALKAAGFHDIAWAAHDRRFALSLGDDPDPCRRAAALMIGMGPLGRRLRALSEAERAPAAAEVERLLVQGLAPHVEDGMVHLDARLWIVTART
ncbi:MAG: class I SAM-dependent methyltransferase [Pseudomonadota bacterium]